ncbi:hypothetical protein N752_10370 [Desulforamulus aquiferis]|nr:DnaJ family domain-containing protein [Desulforamulus aquiferis]RYD05192.1 hypothetical protein N752_10370 [Desulforamulus aquiferis]
MDILSLIAEGKIKEAIERGDLKDLPAKGHPSKSMTFLTFPTTSGAVIFY